MKTVTKILICILALCLLLPFVASCDKKNQSGSHHKPPPQTGDSQQTDPSGSGDGDTVTTPEDPNAGIEMPDVVDMGGYVYKAYVRTHAGDTLDEQLAHGNNRYQCSITARKKN